MNERLQENRKEFGKRYDS